MDHLNQAVARRCAFAIISHPDAGKTTVTEKLLLFGGAINLAGSVKGRKASRHATSDWMELEKQRGISVTTSVMQFVYNDRVVNLLDTPGHADFSEDTYRTLTAVDSALMVIDAAKGVEERTIKLIDVCRLRTTPIMTFINKMDRDTKEPMDVLDEIESVLKIQCVPMTWPIGMGKLFKGIYHILEDRIYLYEAGSRSQMSDIEVIEGLDNAALDELLGPLANQLREEVELVQGAMPAFDEELYLAGEQTPVFFGSAINNFGIRELLNAFVQYAPAPQSRQTTESVVSPNHPKFSGFVFKVQANMDPSHRDRIAFLRITSGQYKKGMKMHHVRLNKSMAVHNAHTFMAGEREHAEEAWPGDIIGLYSHGTIRIGDTFTAGETFKFTGIPNFAPELFRLVRLKDPLRQKALLKGLIQLSEEGATQIFRPLLGNELIVGAVGVLQFDVVAYRLENEYNVRCIYEPVNTVTARWINSDDMKQLEAFKQAQQRYLAFDAGDHLTYLAPSRVSLDLAIEQWPAIEFTATREY